MALVANSCYGQPVSVEAPSVTPLRYGLFSVAQFPNENDPHWQMGVEWQAWSCGIASAYACPTCVQNDGNTAPTKTYTTPPAAANALPFTVYGAFSCSPIGHWDDGVTRATANLINGEERAVELQMATGAAHNSNALTRATSTDITPTPGTPVTIPQGIALLESYGGLNGSGEFVIIMNRREALLANANGTLINPNSTDTQLRSSLNTPVAAISGFDGRTGPNNVAAGAGRAWLFATGVPQIRRSEVFLNPPSREQALSQRTNDFKQLAERTYALGWDCFTVGVLVTSV